jgi:hypothetical protein
VSADHTGVLKFLTGLLLLPALFVGVITTATNRRRSGPTLTLGTVSVSWLALAAIAALLAAAVALARVLRLPGVNGDQLRRDQRTRDRIIRKHGADSGVGGYVAEIVRLSEESRRAGEEGWESTARASQDAISKNIDDLVDKIQAAELQRQSQRWFWPAFCLIVLCFIVLCGTAIWAASLPTS